MESASSRRVTFVPMSAGGWCCLVLEREIKFDVTDKSAACEHPYVLNLFLHKSKEAHGEVLTYKLPRLDLT